MLFCIGRVCVKLSGRESGNKCIVVDIVDDKFVLIDGNVKRKRCNINHLEPSDIILKIKKGASTSEVHKAMSTSGIKVIEKGPKTKRTKKVKSEDGKGKGRKTKGKVSRTPISKPTTPKAAGTD